MVHETKLAYIKNALVIVIHNYTWHLFCSLFCFVAAVHLLSSVQPYIEPAPVQAGCRIHFSNVKLEWGHPSSPPGASAAAFLPELSCAPEAGAPLTQFLFCHHVNRSVPVSCILAFLFSAEWGVFLVFSLWTSFSQWGSSQRKAAFVGLPWGPSSVYNLWCQVTATKALFKCGAKMTQALSQSCVLWSPIM